MSTVDQAGVRSGAPTIALISATFAAVEPAVRGLADVFPDAIPWNLVDDRLLVDANEQGGLTPPLRARMVRLIEHAVAEGSEGVLLTCSLYGDVAQEFDSEAVPVLAADQASFALAIDGAYPRILVVGSLAAAVDDSTQRLRAAVSEAAGGLSVSATVADGALQATTARDDVALLDTLRGAIDPFREEVDAVLLAQYSLAPAAEGLRDALDIPVISGPHASAALMKSLVG
ncbi:hypothetical protein QSU92_13370 [Microbacterium sp. ET2]|uniref:hypothetical protein n=1 Tax=Microbacterium albipurpureum TaxID=3050384 RepID=UPI00259CA800|nr:hypothetical protein [Microbacterium sp. ET2 (Ac-2212)]WJL94944.1 hypothetical protein QSU92_13370 [Microbacterium sp. ET2 (Ac-2212)]